MAQHDLRVVLIITSLYSEAVELHGSGPLLRFCSFRKRYIIHTSPSSRPVSFMVSPYPKETRVSAVSLRRRTTSTAGLAMMEPFEQKRRVLSDRCDHGTWRHPEHLWAELLGGWGLHLVSFFVTEIFCGWKWICELVDEEEDLNKCVSTLAMLAECVFANSTCLQTLASSRVIDPDKYEAKES